MPLFFKLLCILTLCFATQNIVLAQTDKKNPKSKTQDKQKNSLKADTTTAFQLKSQYDNVAQNKETDKPKKKKRKPRIYANIRIRRGVARRVSTSSLTLEFFHVARKEMLLPQDKLIKEIYYYNPKKKIIQYGDYAFITNKIKKGEKLVILHGHYQKIVNAELREEGYFYYGTKNGTWEEYEPYQGEIVLKEKTKYDKGRLADAQITYFDEAGTKIKEVVPMHYQQRTGKYFLYHPNGQIAVEGQYLYDVPIGIWREYHPNQKRKKDIKYPTNFWEKEEPYTLREWNEKGEIIYDIDRDGRKSNK